MPNTVAHFALQAVATRAAFRHAVPKWVLLACVVPDAPWIVNRIVNGLLHLFALDPPWLDPYALRAWFVVQATLAFSLVLSCGLAVLSRAPARTMAILGGGAILHLLADACEIKWGNGVHFFAPVSWRMTSFDLVWPESGLVLAVTSGGFVYAVWAVWAIARAPDEKRGRVRGREYPIRRRAAVSLALLTAWAVLPVLFLSGPESADNHGIRTMRERAARDGRFVQFDRKDYRVAGDGVVVRALNDEPILLVGAPVAGLSTERGILSARGRFDGPTKVVVEEIHEHPPHLRVVFSLMGLSIVAWVWMVAARRRLVGQA